MTREEQEKALDFFKAAIALIRLRRVHETLQSVVKGGVQFETNWRYGWWHRMFAGLHVPC